MMLDSFSIMPRRIVKSIVTITSMLGSGLEQHFPSVLFLHQSFQLHAMTDERDGFLAGNNQIMASKNSGGKSEELLKKKAISIKKPFDQFVTTLGPKGGRYHYLSLDGGRFIMGSWHY